MKTLVDDFSTHVIEEELIRKLSLVLNPEELDMLSDSQIDHLTGEDNAAAGDRVHVSEKLKSLQRAKEELHSLDKVRAEME
ncbi:hypothetical protein LTR95_000968, partial [Oleoguttula sp. CCFEE 5521]